MKRVREETEDGKPSKKTRGDPQFGGVSAEDGADVAGLMDAAKEESHAQRKEETAELAGEKKEVTCPCDLCKEETLKVEKKKK